MNGLRKTRIVCFRFLDNMPFYDLRSIFSIILLVMVSSLTEGSPSATVRPTVTNNDIRDAILQIVNVIRTTEDKLERHEYRERVLGEQLKRGLISIDKRVKQWDHFRGAMTRLDERLAAVETILMQKEEREKGQSTKTFEAVDDIQKNLPIIMEELKKEILQELRNNKKEAVTPKPVTPKPEITKQDFNSLKTDLTKKLGSISDSLNKLDKELKNMKASNESSKDLNEKSNTNLKKIDKLLEKEEQLRKKYEDKLEDYKELLKEPPAQMKEQADWQVNFLKSLNEQKQQIEELQTDLRNISEKLNVLPKTDDIEILKKHSNNLIEEIKQNTNVNAKTIMEDVSTNINDVRMKFTRDHEDIKELIESLTNATENFGEDVEKSYKEMKSDLQSIKKVDEVMVQTADNVLDTKRRLEYGVHQIMGEMGQLMKTSAKDIAKSISDRFDVFELSVLDDENGALANLTNKIGDEIDQVWRQIGIMHQKMNANADILTKLQNQTDAYVNGSSTVMDNMKGKVAKITSKIVELDENLNYLMGRLMLVSHEFNQIKTGLSKALDEIKGTFHTVQDKIKDPGPGPHQIDSYKEPDANRRKRSVKNKSLNDNQLE